MSKIYKVHLTQSEQNALHYIINNHKSTSVKVKRAYILLAADENGSLNWSDIQISEAYGSSISTIERLRKRFVEDSFDIALSGKKRTVFKNKVFTGDVESHLIALRCSNPPEGYCRWSLHLLADKMVELQYVEHMSHEGVRQLLKKTNLSLGK
ncbi:MAG: helix-turn-helix domain-containing protein [Candidatus Brocadiaceae bacterium]|nr:helix-turn-helix domain-containing protein [Candidatus Brocadiaceae bacterium]